MSLSLIDSKYIYNDNLPIYTISDPEYAQIVWEKISEILKTRSVETALDVLLKLTESLPGKVCKMSDYEAMVLSSMPNTEERKRRLGAKHTCGSCQKKFYDLNRFYRCPVCKTAISFTAIST